MQVHMQNAENLSPEQIREFLESSAEIEFGGGGRWEVYAWTERVLVAQEFGCQGKKERGVIRAYMEKITGLSRSQMTRLIRIYLDGASPRTQFLLCDANRTNHLLIKPNILTCYEHPYACP